MGSKDKFFSITTADKGFDDIGFAQPSGSVSAATAATMEGPLFSGKLRLTIDSNALLRKGQAIRIASIGNATSPHTGLTRVLKLIGTTAVVVNLTYDTAQTADGTGTWFVDGGKGAWDAFMPIGADISAANLTVTFHKPNRQGSDENAVDYLSGKLYPFPGTIKTIQLTTAGNLRLYRSASLKPGGSTAGI